MNGHGAAGGLPRIRSRRTLVLVAMVVQLVLLLVAWTIAFRHVRGRIAEAVQDYIVERNADYVEELSERFPPTPMKADGTPAMSPEFGTPEWEDWQRLIESAGADLPGGGFACLLDDDGNILCHPEIRRDPSYRTVNLESKIIKAATRQVLDGSVSIGEASDETISGRVDFVADGTHFVATRKVPGTNLRLLVHQPEAELFGAANQLTGVVVTSGAIAAGAVVLLGGLGLFGVIRSYDSSFERVNKTLKDNLEIARQIQQSTLPERVPTLEGFDVAAWSASADETGGDTYDVVALAGSADSVSGLGVTDGHADALVCVLADATGHGIGAALAISAFRSMVRMGLRAGADLPALVQQVNGQMAADLPSGRFVTGWLGFVDRAAGGVLSFAAGQGPLLVRRADGTVESYDADAVPFGILDDIDVKAGRFIELAAGEAVVVASDGIFESRSPGGELFGLDRFRGLVAERGGGSSDELIAAMREAVDTFTQGGAADDDRTVVVVRRV